jgi:hypothetical protein
MGFGVDGGLPGGACFGTMSKVLRTRPALPGIKPNLDFEYPAPPNINKLPSALESMTMHEASVLGTGVEKSSIVCPVMLADGDVSIKASVLSIHDINASLQAKQDPFKRQYEHSALYATPETLPCN